MQDARFLFDTHASLGLQDPQSCFPSVFLAGGSWAALICLYFQCRVCRVYSLDTFFVPLFSWVILPPPP